jgi:DNA-binding response OmpR family regulator/signal transduction histidine kinase
LLIQLRQAEDRWQLTDILDIQVLESVEQSMDKLIYLYSEDAILVDDLCTYLQHEGYRICHFSSANDFSTACATEMPNLIILDMAFINGDAVTMDVSCSLKDKDGVEPLMIIVSPNDDIQARLAAARLGARRYFSKPVNIKRLGRTLDGLTMRISSQPFRVLIIGDDEILLEFYATVLRGAGMHVQTLSRLLEALQVMAEFKPEILVMDICMPGCSGPELAQVIRQDDVWALVSIIFLSSETGLGQRLAALDFGGDDFLLKPIEMNHLVNAITARVKQARRTSQLNNKLKHALRESKYQLIAMNQHDIVSVTDVNGLITSANDKFCEASGYSRQELLGQSHRILKSGFHAAAFYSDMWRSEQGEALHMLGVVQDITEQMQAEIRLRKYNEILELVARGGEVQNILQDMVRYAEIIMDGGICSILLLDESAKYLCHGVAPGLPDFYNEAIDGVKAELGVASWGEAACSGERVIVSDIMAHPNWKAFSKVAKKAGLGACWSEPFFSSSGAVLGVFSIYYTRPRKADISELKLMGELAHFVTIIVEKGLSQQALVDAKEKAENASFAKSKFLSSMSHELRTPMNAIIGFGHLRAGNHPLELINEILDLSRIEAGCIDLSIEAVELDAVIAESLQLIAPLAQKRNISIEQCNVKREQLSQQHFVVRADRTRLRQVLLNLLSNAVKYNYENGKIIIVCNRIANNRMRISISDTGAGLNAEQQAQLFNAFNRLGAERSGIEGTGIGLVISKNIIELMGGNIGVHSQVGKGSTFWVELSQDSLPIKHTQALAEMETSAAKQAAGKDRQHTALYIEDNPANLKLITQLLARRANILMYSTDEPVRGLELAAKYRPDLILLDINLPGMHGYEVLKKLRQQEATRNTIIIAISSNAMPKDIAKGLRAGFNEYITKPIDVRVFLQAVDRALQINA